MSSFVALRSRRISLDERSHSSFAVFVSLLCVDFSLSLSLSILAMPLAAVNGKYRLECWNPSWSPSLVERCRRRFSPPW
jgi:hypothetical protein